MILMKISVAHAAAEPLNNKRGELNAFSERGIFVIIILRYFSYSLLTIYWLRVQANLTR